MDSNRASTPIRRLRRALGASLAALALGAMAAPAFAEPPMWVVKDKDSTIYLFGTVHLLDPTIEWKTARVQKAIDDATQLWVEIAIPQGGEVEMAMSMLQRALAPGQPLSSRLTEEERAQLKKLLSRSPESQQLGMVIEMTKPWFATITLGVMPLMAAGYDAAAGADIVLTQVAREQGDEVIGLETADQQIDWLSSGTDEEQLAALKRLLAVPEAQFDEMMGDMDAGVRAWMKGDTGPLEKVSEEWRNGKEDPLSAGMSYDLMIVRRNENWAGQLEKLLAGKGVAFVAVGAGHLVGKDSLQAKLAARGIKAKAY